MEGAYRILIKDPRDMQTATISLTTGAEGLSVEADAAHKAGPKRAVYGLSCWASEEQGYFFLVSPDAVWGIVKWIEGTTPSFLVESETENAIEGFSDTNRIRGECVGGGQEPTALALYVNGKKIATAEDRNGLASFRKVGLTVWVGSDEAGTDIRFDDFAARELETKAARQRINSQSPPETVPSHEEAPSPETVPSTTSESSVEELCKRDGVRYAGTTAQGAEVCVTLTPDGSAWVEIGYSFVPASGCPDMATGKTYSEGPVPLDAPGRIKLPGSFEALIDGGSASGVFADSDICPGRKFKWSARRAP